MNLLSCSISFLLIFVCCCVVALFSFKLAFYVVSKNILPLLLPLIFCFSLVSPFSLYFLVFRLLLPFFLFLLSFSPFLLPFPSSFPASSLSLPLSPCFSPCFPFTPITSSLYLPFSSLPVLFKDVRDSP